MSVFTGILLDELERLGGADIPLPDGGSVRVIDCGRRPGYLPEKAALLGRIAERAAEHGEEVTWG